MQYSFRELQRSLPQQGTVKAIYIRPDKYVDPLSVHKVQVSQHNGLDGDHYHSVISKKRQVTLIQHEHIDVIARLMDQDLLDASILRRNIVVSGINLLALKDHDFSIGSAALKMTGLCHPCSRMEKALGPGGYNAMRGHGGITATVTKDGVICLGDTVSLVY